MSQSVERALTLVQALADGPKTLDQLAEGMATQIATNVGIESTRPPHETLSDREFTVMRMMASGVTPRDIAQQLSLSIKTVSTYRSRILQKLVLQNNAQLIAYALPAHSCWSRPLPGGRAIGARAPPTGTRSPSS